MTPVDVPEIDGNRVESTLFAVSGTVTGRWSHTKPNFIEKYRTGPMKFAEMPKDPPDLTMIKADYSKIEARVLAWMARKPEKVKPKPVSRVNLTQMLAQASAAAKEMESWAEKMRADGWVQGEGAAWDEWTKEDD